MISEGFRLMFVGMGVVFAFLLLMVLMMYVSSAVCLKLSPVSSEDADPGSSGALGGAQDDEANCVAAIAAAIRDRWPG